MRVISRPGDELLRYIERLYRAVARRDPLRASWLLGDALAVHLPREVIEEVLVLSRAPQASLRAPVHLLRYYHRTVELLRGETEESGDEAQLKFDFDHAGQS